MQIRLSQEITFDSIVDGTGLRTVVWTQGCSHNCYMCHNPQTHDFNGGFLKDIDELAYEILKVEMQSGVTISGGDGMFQLDELICLAKILKENKINIWVYTGFVFEDLIKNEKALELFNYIDVLVDGKFIFEEKSYDVTYRGSKNQRIIDIPNSIKERKAITLDY